MRASGVSETAAEVVACFERRRYRIDYGHYAEVGIEGRQWSGRSGRALSTLPPRGVPASGPDLAPDVLWLLDVGRG
jgi:hypothetical protein